MNEKADVLLVEDDECLARAMLRQLRSRGIGVTLHTSVTNAAEVKGNFRVGIFDIELPDGDGVSLAKDLLARRVVSRAVFNTGCSDPQRLQEAKSVGPVFEKSASLPLVSYLTGPSVVSAALPAALSSSPQEISRRSLPY